MKFEKNESQWPIVSYTISGDLENIEEFNKILNSWSEMYVRSSETKEKFRLLLNVTEMGKVGPSYIMSFVKFLKECKTLNSLWMEKTAIYLENASSKYIFDFVMLFYTPTRPLKIFNDKIEEPLKWLISDNLI